MESLVGRVRHIALRRAGRLEESIKEHRVVVDAIKLETIVVRLEGERF
jgi:hypothetical protein